jgi:hypothetical protein
MMLGERRYCLVEGCERSFAPNNHDIVTHLTASSEHGGHSLDKDIHLQLLRQRGPLSPFVASSTSVTSPQDQDRCTQSLVRMIADCNLPPALLDRPSMRQFLDEIRATRRWSPPSRRQFLRPSSGTLAVFAKSIEANIKQDLLDVLTFGDKCSVSLTFDIWSEQGRSFIGVTAFYINSHWDLKRSSLGLYDFNQSHTAEAVASKLRVSTQSFIQFSNVFAATHDSASNNTGKQFVPATPGLVRIRCLAHRASNASKMLFKMSKSAHQALMISRKVAKVFTKSSRARHMLHKMHVDAKTTPTKMRTVAPTRFNCGHELTTSMLEQKAYLAKAIVELRLQSPSTVLSLANYVSVLSSEEFWDTMTQIHSALDPLNDFITELQTTDIHLSDALSMLRKALDKTSGINNKYSAKVQRAVKQYFDDIFSPTSAFVICAALDPRTKDNFFFEQR